LITKISIIIFVIMLLFPIVFSLVFLRKSDGKTLEVQHSKMRDPRYFAKSFTKLFDKNRDEYSGSGKIFLSREENILEADKTEEYPSVCDCVVYAENLEFRPHSGICFGKEIYSCQNAYLFGIEQVRAICCKKDMVLGNGTQVIRWVDAEGMLTVHDDCDLGISASSNTKIVMGKNCRFRRVYAPEIYFGSLPGEDNHNGHSISSDSVIKNVFRDIKYVDDGLVAETSVLKGSIITRHDITVLDHLTVRGHIRSHKSIRLCDGAVVYGNLFAEGDIYLGKNARVYGSVFTQQNIFAESGVIIGQRGKIKSVVARRKAVFDNGCRVYGYVTSEMRGECCPDAIKSSNLRKTDEDILPEATHPHWYRDLLMEKPGLAAISTVMLIVVIATSMFATSMNIKEQEREAFLEEAYAASLKPVYGADGKPDGGELDTVPTVITKDHVYFEDRVLERFYYDANDIRKCSEILNGAMSSLPEDVNKYLMIVPMRISFEDEKHQLYSDDIDSAINELYERMPPDVITLDAAGALYEHRGEYLFFRTSNKWTALGAYYAAQEFCNNTGIEMKRIEEYRENRYENYKGTLQALPYSQSLDNYKDYISYYILEGTKNEQTITDRRSRDEYITYNAPTIALSRLGYDIFVGSYFSHTILRGDAKNGKTLMILGDDYIKPFAPWLTPYYENVCLVSPRYFDGGPEEFWKLFSEYQITEFLVVEYVQNMRDSTVNIRIGEICAKQ